MKKTLFIILLSLIPIASRAQFDPDFSKPLELSGDFLSFNLNAREGVYQGNFIAKQGSMSIEGNEIELKQKKNKQLDRIIALGHSVEFKKKNYQTGELINGSAEKITYDANRLLVTLEGNAEISSDSGKSFKSAKITYGLTSGEIKAVGNGQRRVQIIIPPNSTKESMPLIK